MAVSLVILILYEGFYLIVYYFLPHRCTLHRNISNKSYALLLVCAFTCSQTLTYLFEGDGSKA